MPRLNHRWASKPGHFDALNTSRLFPASNSLGIPDLRPAPLSAIPDYLIPYDSRVRAQTIDLTKAAIHFFQDDYRFEQVWSKPEKTLQGLDKYRIVLTPDFSLFSDWPVAVQLWNVYRARWCGCLWQEAGFQVIPTVSWGTPDSYRYAFLGLPAHSLLAVGTIGVDLDTPLVRQHFSAGFTHMVNLLNPTTVLCYGPLPDDIADLVSIVDYPSRWYQIHKRRQGGDE